MMLIDEILSRLGDHLHTDVDADIARELNVSPQRLSGWRKRGTIPWEELCVYAAEHDIPFDWLFAGRYDGKNTDVTTRWSEELKNLCLDLRKSWKLPMSYL